VTKRIHQRRNLKKHARRAVSAARAYEIEVPVGRRRRPASAAAVGSQVLLLGRDAKRREVEAREALEGGVELGRQVVRHAVVREVGQWIADGRQLPVEHRQHLVGLGVEHEVVEAEVAVHQRRAAVARHRGAQPRHQLLHGGRRRFAVDQRRVVLPAPAR